LHFLVIFFQDVIDFVFGKGIVFVQLDELVIIQAENPWLLVIANVLDCYGFCPTLALLAALSVE
jgi:hypothetical protein